MRAAVLVAVKQSHGQAHEDLAVDQAQDLDDILAADQFFTEGKDLVEQAESVPDRTFGLPDDEGEGRRFDLKTFGGGEPVGNGRTVPRPESVSVHTAGSGRGW